MQEIYIENEQNGLGRFQPFMYNSTDEYCVEQMVMYCHSNNILPVTAKDFI